MARTTLTVTIESEAVLDAAAELAFVQGALARRHGAAFRALDRDIEALDNFIGEAVSLEGMHLAFTASPELTNLLRRARAIGLLPH